ncbi:hypothetical protein [Embleya sp. MST-111070]|uniref:hypothetical protein n=1 Tax=Embleya sp. MST-111070 TaxID=3398231 RepID=UPI003F73FD9F
MTSVDDTLRKLIASFPCLFATRMDALHHALVRTGTGFEWRHGKVVSRHQDNRTCVSLHRDDWQTTQRMKHLGLDTPDIPENCPAEELRARAGELARSGGELSPEIIASENPNPSALFLNAPIDAAPEWLYAAQEVADAVRPLWTSAPCWTGKWERALTQEQLAFVGAQHSAGLERFRTVFGAQPSRDR